jgi:hypothetical protein
LKKGIILVLFSLLISYYVIQKIRKNYLTKTGFTRTNNPINLNAIDSFYNLLQPGDIVFRRGADAISDLFCKMNQKDNSFSHLGIVLAQNDSLFVFHSIGGEDNPDEKIRKENFPSFVTPHLNIGLGFMRMPIGNSELRQLDSIVKAWYFQKRTFDMKFNLNTDDKLYCAEFVYKAFRYAKKDSTLFSTSKANKLFYIAPDNIFLDSNAITKGKYTFQ